MRIQLLIIVILTTLALTNCKREDKCIEYQEAFVIDTNTPSTGQINQDIPIRVSFGCLMVVVNSVRSQKTNKEKQ